MNKKIDKAALASRIQALEGLSSEDKSALLELLSEQKRYGLVWENSSEEVEALLREKLPVLTEDTTKRILADTIDEVPNHILIEGDNYPALVALQYDYEGKVDVIYIDPPYNTGKEFCYNDKIVDENDCYRHSKWISFMKKRLRLAKRLISESGFIFISIDDHEQANLKLLCDEIFGEKNFVTQIMWKRKKEISSDSSNVAIQGEYILCYSSSEQSIFNLESLSEDYINKSYNNPTDEFPIAKWRPVPLTVSKGLKGGGYKYSIITPKGETHTRIWAYPESSYKKLLEQKLVYFGKDGRSVPQRVLYLSDNKGQPTTNYWDAVATNKEGKKEILAIFGENIFDTPKPTGLIQKILKIASNSTSIILDFFAGSGTTLHATMQLNAEDGGHRQCILVTNNENNICEEVTYERNKRVIQGYTTPKGQQVEGLKNNNLRYYKVDFVDREKTAANQKELMKASTDLLCIKENLYQEETSFRGLKLHTQIARCFSDGVEGGKMMLIIYEPNAIPALVKRIEQMTVEPENKLKVYVMSEGQYPYTEDFESVLSKVELRAMPHALYQAMRQVLPPLAEAENTEPDMEVSDEEADGSMYKTEEP